MRNFFRVDFFLFFELELKSAPGRPLIYHYFVYQENLSQENIVYIFVLIFTLNLCPPKFPHKPLNITHCRFYGGFLVLLERAVTLMKAIFFEKADQL